MPKLCTAHISTIAFGLAGLAGAFAGALAALVFRDLVTDMSDLAIVGAIIAMARHLNIQVVAEGIEGWQQLEKLRQLGCSLAQGYLFAKAAPQDQCQRFLSGIPLDLTENDPLVEALESTGNQRVAAG